jgi:hypothetical protein
MSTALLRELSASCQARGEKAMREAAPLEAASRVALGLAEEVETALKKQSSGIDYKTEAADFLKSIELPEEAADALAAWLRTRDGHLIDVAAEYAMGFGVGLQRQAAGLRSRAETLFEQAAEHQARARAEEPKDVPLPEED